MHHDTVSNCIPPPLPVKRRADKPGVLWASRYHGVLNNALANARRRQSSNTQVSKSASE